VNESPASIELPGFSFFRYRSRIGYRRTANTLPGLASTLTTALAVPSAGPTNAIP